MVTISYQQWGLVLVFGISHLIFNVKAQVEPSFWPVTISPLHDRLNPIGKLLPKPTTNDEALDFINTITFQPNDKSNSFTFPSNLATFSFWSHNGSELGFSSIQCPESCQSELIIRIDNQGEPSSFTFTNVAAEKSDKKMTITHVSTLNPVQGASPRLFLDYQDEYAKKGGEESKSFLVRYWYIVIPAVFILLLTAGTEEDDGSPPARPIASR